MSCALLEERKISVVCSYKLRPLASLNRVGRVSLILLFPSALHFAHSHTHKQTQNTRRQHLLMDPHFFPATKSLQVMLT